MRANESTRGAFRAILPCRPSACMALAVMLGCCPGMAQTPAQADTAAQIQNLTQVLERTQAQLEESQRQLNAVREQLAALEEQMAQKGAVAPAAAPSASSSPLAAAVDDLREQQAVQQAEIATHEQTKVESASKYPLRITGLLLFNGFVNTGQVNAASTPTIALGGPGSTGATVKQTILGFDARGPHLFGASTFAGLSVDFAGGSQAASGTGSFAGPYGSTAALLRLRTAHAALQWSHTQAFFSLDRPIVSPDSPTSLAAVAEPALAWSGNLWTWNPQLGVTRNIPFGSSLGMRLQAALIDAADAPLSPQPPSGTAPTLAEQSRWPGVESRLALFQSGGSDEEDHVGMGGYFAPHRLNSQLTFDSWAATLDAAFHLPARLQFTSNAYRGLALGGLGGGAYKDIAYYYDASAGYYIRPLDNAGGWAQLKEQFNSHLQLNAAFGADMVFAHQLRPYATPAGSLYQNLAATRTWTGNILLSPSAALLFSLEYRRLESTPVFGAPAGSNIVGLAAGYKF